MKTIFPTKALLIAFWITAGAWVTFHSQGSAAPVTLISTGAVWKYLANGSDAGTQWVTSNYDDSGWSNGVAKFGFGADSEVTVVGNATNAFITFYFRHSFTVSNAASITGLLARLVRDDGAVVYLNGIEAFRNNMPSNVIDYLTFASSTLNRPDETNFVTNAISPALLAEGPNQLAVEVHQAVTNSSDLGFELALIGNPTNAIPPASVTLTSPTNGVSLLAGNDVIVTATATDPAGILRVDFYLDGARVFQDLAAPYTFTLADVAAGAHVLTAVLVSASGGSLTSTPVNLSATNRPGVSILIANGATWKYLDDGSNQGTLWRNPDFDDSAWSSGVAELGYGDETEAPPRPERTVINGGPTTNRFITSYFRRTFNLASTNGINLLTVRLLRDDGAVVYINGSEVTRQNMPASLIDSGTPASTPMNGTNETIFFVTNLVAPLPFLVAGTNVVAVEVHQNAINSSDVSFDLALDAVFMNAPPVVSILQPANGATFSAGANVSATVSASDLDGGVLRVGFYVNGQLRGFVTNAPYIFSAGNNLGVGTYTLVAVATDTLGLNTTSAPVVIECTLEPGVVTLLPNRSCWKYWDKGTDLGTAWQGVDYDDNAWPMGLAELGYGDGDEATVVGFGPDANNKYITTYFRRTFSVSSANTFTNLILRLKRDDGAVVYLNGAEVFRDNLPSGSINYLTPASLAADDGADFISTNLNPAFLQPEQNVLAVEIHQTLGNSSDISFDLQLLGEAGAALPTLNVVSASASQLVLGWPATASANFILQSTTQLGNSNSWTAVANPVSNVGGQRYVTNAVGPAGKFFRLCAASVETSLCQSPVIISQALGFALPAGTNVTLSVTTAGAGPFFYQWRKNERFLSNATSATLTLTNLQRGDAGAYDVLVRNHCLCIESCPIELTVGAVGPAPSDFFASRPSISGTVTQFNGTLAGFTIEAGEPLNPASLEINSGWVQWTAPSNGPVTLDTAGSGFRTAIAVFRGATLGTLTLESAVGPSEADGSSRLQFTAAAGTAYQFRFSGRGLVQNFAANLVQLSGSACAIAFLQQPQSQLVQTGAVVNFTVVATNGACGTNAALTYQWRRDGVNIAGATNATLTLNNVSVTSAAAYSVQVANGFTTTVSTAGTLGITVSTGPGSGIVTLSTTEFTTSSGSCGTTGFSNKQFFCFRMADNSLVSSCSGGYSQLLPPAGDVIGNRSSLNVFTWMDGSGNISSTYNNGRDTAMQISRLHTVFTCVSNAPCTNNLPFTQANICCDKLSQGFMSFGTCDKTYAYVKVIVYYNTLTAPYTPVLTGTGCTQCIPSLGTPGNVAIRWQYQ